jgi:hypothetical protein
VSYPLATGETKRRALASVRLGRPSGVDGRVSSIQPRITKPSRLHTELATLTRVEPSRDPRHVGTLEPLWNLLDLTPEGRPTDCDVQLSYT